MGHIESPRCRCDRDSLGQHVLGLQGAARALSLLGSERLAPPLSSCFSSSQIQVGKFNYTIAMLHLGGGETAIIVSIVICSILLVLSVVGKGTE